MRASDMAAFSPEDLARRRRRSIAVALVLAALVVLFYVTTIVRLGGHVRVGFENNLDLPDGSRADSNADLVRAVAGILAPGGIKLLDADGLRQSWTHFS